jgi:hypothetical protein
MVKSTKNLPAQKLADLTIVCKAILASVTVLRDIDG